MLLSIWITFPISINKVTLTFFNENIFNNNFFSCRFSNSHFRINNISSDTIDNAFAQMDSENSTITGNDI